MDHWRMARRMGLSFDDFWSLTPAQFDMFVDDWWDDKEHDNLPLARIEALIHNISVLQGSTEDGPAPELLEPVQCLTYRRLSNFRPGYVRTVEGWVSEDEYKASQVRVQQEAQRKIELRMVGG